jgi:hypothetical protein
MSKQYKFFFYYSIFSIIFILSLLISFNYYFSKKVFLDLKIKDHILKIRNNKLISPANIGDLYFDRYFKIGLAQYSTSECYLVGSSQHTVINYEYLRSGKKINDCKNLDNLSLQTATLEDYAILSYFLIKKEQKPKKIIFALESPIFLFNFDPSSRWKVLDTIFYEFIKIAKIEYIYFRDYNFNTYLDFNLLKNNLYFIFEKNLLINSFDKKDNFKLTENLAYYDSYGVINNRKEEKRENVYDMVGFTDNYEYDKATFFFEKMLVYLNSLDIEIELLLLPYRPDVYDNSTWASDIKKFDKQIQYLKKKYNLKILGTLYPEQADCVTDDFIDKSHPKINCILKSLNIDY